MKLIISITLIQILFYCQCLCQSTKQTSDDPYNQVYYEDSVGNRITPKRAKSLLKTGEYISIPVMDELMEVEHVVRRKTEADGDKYQTLTDGQTIISGTGLSIPELKLSLGDTIPNLNPTNYLGKNIPFKDLDTPVLIFIDSTNWISTRKDLENLIKNFPEIDYLFISQNETQNLTDLFTRRLLERNTNIYLNTPVPEYWKSSTPFCYIINQHNQVELLIPNLPNPDIGISALFQYLNRDR